MRLRWRDRLDGEPWWTAPLPQGDWETEALSSELKWSFIDLIFKITSSISFTYLNLIYIKICQSVLPWPHDQLPVELYTLTTWMWFFASNIRNIVGWCRCVLVWESSILDTQSIIKCQKIRSSDVSAINFYFGGLCQQFIWYSVTDRLIHEMGGTESGTVSWILGTQSVWNNFVSKLCKPVGLISA